MDRTLFDKREGLRGALYAVEYIESRIDRIVPVPSPQSDRRLDRIVDAAMLIHRTSHASARKR